MGSYFEGTYYKHQKEGETICFIVGKANSGSFVQVISNGNVWQYEGTEGFRDTGSGIAVDLPKVKGEVRYGAFAPLRYDIMGPFRFLPMQCRHQVQSMYHSLSGGFWVDGKRMDLDGGVGYIEGDRGRSFPKEYLWLHCNDFQKPCSIMASVADIPFLGRHFMGCICAILFDGREYRLATYRGVRIREASEKRLLLEQGRYRFEARIDGSHAFPLKAPQKGHMVGTVHESNCTDAQFRFWEDGKLLLEQDSKNTSFECNLTTKAMGIG